MDGPTLDTLMPITLPQVNFIANPFGSITRGVIATIYTLWVMVGVRQGGLLVFRPPIVPEQVCRPGHVFVQAKKHPDENAAARTAYACRIFFSEIKINGP